MITWYCFAPMGPTLCACLDDPYGSLNASVWPQGGTFGRARPPLRRPGDGCGCSAIAVLPTCRGGAAAGMLPWARNSCPSCSRKHDRAISIRPWDSFTNAIRHQRRRLRRRRQSALIPQRVIIGAAAAACSGARHLGAYAAPFKHERRSRPGAVGLIHTGW